MENTCNAKVVHWEQLVLCAAIMMIVNSFTGGLNRHSVPGAIEGIGVSDRLIELAWRITGGCWSTTPATGAIAIIIFIIVIIAIVIIVAIGIIIIAIIITGHLLLQLVPLPSDHFQIRQKWQNVEIYK